MNVLDTLAHTPPPPHFILPWLCNWVTTSANSPWMTEYSVDFFNIYFTHYIFVAVCLGWESLAAVAWSKPIFTVLPLESFAWRCRYPDEQNNWICLQWSSTVNCLGTTFSLTMHRPIYAAKLKWDTQSPCPHQSQNILVTDWSLEYSMCVNHAKWSQLSLLLYVEERKKRKSNGNTQAGL